MEHFIKDKEKAHTLFTELSSSQHNTKQMFKNHETRQFKMNKQERKYKGLGPKQVCLAYIIKFVDEDRTLLSLLMLNKETARVMSRFVCR